MTCTSEHLLTVDAYFHRRNNFFYKKANCDFLFNNLDLFFCNSIKKKIKTLELQEDSEKTVRIVMLCEEVIIVRLKVTIIVRDTQNSEKKSISQDRK